MLLPFLLFKNLGVKMSSLVPAAGTAWRSVAFSQHTTHMSRCGHLQQAHSVQLSLLSAGHRCVNTLPRTPHCTHTRKLTATADVAALLFLVDALQHHGRIV